MKYLLSTLILISSVIVMAQSPNAFNYQAVIRDGSGDIQANQSIAFKFTIMQSNTSLYEETHSTTSNSFGLVNLKIGTGVVLSGSWSAIDWAKNTHNLKIEVDLNGGSNYTLLSSSKLISVPYAMHAETATHVDDADADSSNEIQQLSFANDVLSLSKNGGSADLSSYDSRMTALEQQRVSDSTALTTAIKTNSNAILLDHDKDSSNEIQTLSASNDTLYLSKGGFVTFTNLITWQWNGNNLYFNTGKVGIGTDSPDMLLHIIDSSAHSATTYKNGFLIESDITQTSSGSYAGIYAETKGSANYTTAVDGTSDGVSTGVNYGVGGYANKANTNVGVEAFAYGKSKINYGLDGFAWNGKENYGVKGFVRANSNNSWEHVGVSAEVKADNGVGRALSVKTTGKRPGTGIFSEALNDSSNTSIIGYALSKSSNNFSQYGVVGSARGDWASNTSGTGNHYGVWGEAFGKGEFNIGLYGQSASKASSASSVNRGVEGYSLSSTTQYGQGVFGNAKGTRTKGYNAGVVGSAGNNSITNYAVLALTDGKAAENFGVASYAYGTPTSGKVNTALYGYAASADTNIGLQTNAISAGKVNYGLYSEATTTNNSLSGYFLGNVVVSGNLSVTGAISKGSGTFKIDYPLDPENKVLVHSFVESPDMMNIYNGNIVTDAQGFATVTLPEYFENCNMNFRYQLTAIGQFAQCIVAEKINNNQFTIQTDKPNVEVSWQVTGVRNDPYAQKNRITAIQEKPEDQKGHYIHPKAYGKDESKAIYGPISTRQNVQHLEEFEESTRASSPVNSLPIGQPASANSKNKEKHRKEK